MKAILLQTTIGDDGVLKIETPTEYKNVLAEVVLVIQPAQKDVTSLGYPLHYFEAIDAIDADDMVERPVQGAFEDRESIE